MSTAARPARRADAVRNRQLALEAATALLGERGATLTVDTIAQRAGLGSGTVMRAFGSKDALLDAAVAGLLDPVVTRARDLLSQVSADQALRMFLGELIAFQAAHHAISNQLDGLDLPATTALRDDLVRAVEQMITGARRDGAIRTDIDTATLTELIGQTAFAVARSMTDPRPLAAAYLTVLMDGLRPR